MKKLFVEEESLKRERGGNKSQILIQFVWLDPKNEKNSNFYFNPDSSFNNFFKKIYQPSSNFILLVSFISFNYCNNNS